MKLFSKLFWLVAVLCTLGFPLIILLGFLGSVHPVFDTIANFRFHIALCCFLLAIVWFFYRQLQIGLAIALVGVFGFAQSLAGLPKLQHTPIAPESKIYTMLYFNMRFDNPKRSEVLDLIEKHDPDIFSGVEFSSLWSDVVERLKQRYPAHFHCPEWNNIGGLYMFFKFEKTEKPAYCHAYAATGIQQVVIDGKAIEIVGAHLRWPWPASQPRQLRELEPVLTKFSEHVLVAGDFNASTWTYAIQFYASKAKLNVIPNIGPTWLVRLLPDFMRPWVGLPIDNVMYKGAIKIIGVERLDATGSDHLPLLIRFTLAE